ncbi:Virulence factor family protein [Candidatus Zixiibacteriota bacterium]|nr:Virulence factor family protein [candidate division Zixibacteria bacterium]
MKKVVLLILLAGLTAQAQVTVDSLQFGRFGKVMLYSQTAKPSRVIIFVSGDGGWNLGVVDMAKEVASQNALVAGIDIIHYLKQLDNSPEPCSYPAADFEALSQYMQKKLDLPEYIMPILIGYSSGATLVYAILAQAPPNTFAAAISMGFCPDLPVTKPFCKGSGLSFEKGPKGKGYNFLPTNTLTEPWIAFQGLIDQVCNAKDVDNFVKKVKNAELVQLPKVGHGFAVYRNWMPQFRQTLKRISTLTDTASAVSNDPSPVSIKDLPLVELPPSGPNVDLMAVIVSGDGGWANIDRTMGEYFASQGIPVVGLNSLKYFWKRRTPDSAAIDLERIIDHYKSLWKKDRVLLVGYSRGADVLPFMANRLPENVKKDVIGVALLGLEDSVDFQFHLSDWLGGGSSKNALPVKPEVDKLKGMNVLCFYGRDEDNSLCLRLDTTRVKAIATKGGHHFGGDYNSIARTIIDYVGR